MIGKPRPGAWIIGLLRFPGDDAAFDIDLPTAGPSTVHAMRGTHDLVVGPALAIGIFPVPIFYGGNAVALGKRTFVFFEEGQTIKKMTHANLLLHVDMGAVELSHFRQLRQ